MTYEQTLIVGVLVATMGAFLWGRWRHDMVAVGSLLVCVLLGLVPSAAAFSGFGHPAVITVACVLVLSRGLQTSGAVDALAQRMLPGTSAGPTLTIAAITAMGAVLSAFMNNVGALALLMPLGIQVAARLGLPPGKVLMPLAFGSILGGMTTLIGTPPNLIVSGFRAETGAGHFAMFDFTPVGIAVAGLGVIFVGLVGWRIVPTRKRSGSAGFDTGTYLTEVRIGADSKAAGKRIREIEVLLEKSDAQVVGLIHREVRLIAPHPGRLVREGDILVVEADPGSLSSVLSSLGAKLEEAVAPAKTKPEVAGADEADSAESANDSLSSALDVSPDDESVAAEKAAKAEKAEKAEKAKKVDSDEILISEFAVLPESGLAGLSATSIRLRTRFGINLLAISRKGRSSVHRLRITQLNAGDVLLMQGPPEALADFASENRCVPLAQRAIQIPDRKKAWQASGVMVASVGAAAVGLLPAAIAFAGGVLAAMALRVVSLRSVYDAIDWPVIVLLGALLPVAGAMSSTGAADVIAGVLLNAMAQGDAVLALVVVLIVTMVLTDFMNNAATAAVMCPIALGTAQQLGVNADPFLMAVAVGASCAFLTPIGHQNNTLILGPGGFGFGDYWRLGLPLDILVVAVAVPMLLWVWPL